MSYNMKKSDILFDEAQVKVSYSGFQPTEPRRQGKARQGKCLAHQHSPIRPVNQLPIFCLC